MFRHVGNFSKRWLKNLADKSTWEEFYDGRCQDSHFDWFLSYDCLEGYLKPLVDAMTVDYRHHEILRILDIGCGISDLGVRLFTDMLNKKGHVDCIDFSESAINFMRRKYMHLQNISRSELGVSFICADATDLPFEDNKYNIVLDKGTTDAALRHRQGEILGKKVISEALRVTRCPGMIIQISDESPDMRLQFLQRCCYDKSSFLTSVKFKELGMYSGIEYILYTIEKKYSP